jgi:hypothetical protein
MRNDRRGTGLAVVGARHGLAAADTAACVAARPTYPRPLNGLILLMVGVALLLGCSGREPARPTPPPSVADAPPPPPPLQPAQPPPLPSAVKAPETVQKKAAVGVGKKGRDYGQGFVVTPIAALFAVRERTAFEIQIPQAMQLFKAEKDRAPKDHAEFMEQIIQANHIRLPELPEGDRYLYDPKTEQLMVARPAPTKDSGEESGTEKAPPGGK